MIAGTATAAPTTTSTTSIDEYSVPVDPMDDLYCDSCQ